MTTHEQPTSTTSATTKDAEPMARAENPSTATETAEMTTRSSAAESAEPEPTGEPATREPATGEPGTAEAATALPPTDEPLFADGALSGLRSRWDDVQAAFVDDPKECVQKADALVTQVVEQLTTGFSEARSRLEVQWAKGEQASTEDLRLALKRYREFFQRLLSV